MFPHMLSTYKIGGVGSVFLWFYYYKQKRKYPIQQQHKAFDCCYEHKKSPSNGPMSE